jgi:asparagine synthase (glutamine-hydrolysing)
MEPVFEKDPRGSVALHACLDLWDLYRMHRGVFMPWELPQILDREVARAGLEELAGEQTRELANLERLEANSFALISYLETTRYMRNQLLRDTDWIGMHYSLEIRVPFVDHVLLEAVTGLASAGRLGEGKGILRQVLRAGLPEKVLHRKKSGFVVPIWSWLNSSPDLGAWKRSPLLRRPYNRPMRRWAYMLLDRLPGSPGMLRT